MPSARRKRRRALPETALVAARLVECEAVIERGLASFMEVGQALLEIRDSRLYRETHGTFEDYCLVRWSMTDRRARYLIDAVAVGTIVPVQNEAQARELAPLLREPDGPERVAEVWAGVRAEHGENVTAAAVREAVRPSMQAHYSSETDEWYTPAEIVERVVETLGAIDLDPCSPAEPTIPTAAHFTIHDDGLAQRWHGRIYMNPPYGTSIAAWVSKLCESYAAGDVTEAVALVPARVDTSWFRLFRDHFVCFISGRLRFSGQPMSAPFPSAAVYLGNRPERFRAAFDGVGDVWKRVEE